VVPSSPSHALPVELPAGRAPAPALLVEHVSKRFAVGSRTAPVEAVSDVSLRLSRGTIHGVLGANGSGKSTLVRLIAGLLTLDSGRVEVFGRDVVRDELEENLTFAARVYGLEVEAARRQVYAILERLHVSRDRVDRPIQQMSRGMQQKVAIARAFLTSPVLLLLDEPTTGLDPRSKLDVRSFVEELRDTHDTTIVLTTHDLEEAELLSDRITILDAGRVVAEDTPQGLLTSASDRLGRAATLWDVFMASTGRSLDDDVAEDADEAIS